MQSFFFGIVSVLIIIWIFKIFDTDNIKANLNKLDAYKGYIVTDQVNDFFLPNYTTIRKDSLKYSFKSDDIIFNNFEIGDTIK